MLIPFTVRVTGGLVLQSADVAAAGALYGFSHSVPGLAMSTLFYLCDAEV